MNAHVLAPSMAQPKANVVFTGVLAALNLIFIVLTFWLMPETKGVSLEQIERNLLGGKRLREIGR